MACWVKRLCMKVFKDTSSRSQIFKKWGFLFDSPSFKTASSATPQGFTASEDAEIKPRTVATSALAVRRSNRSARSNPLPDLL
jgi:hypothetical protein